MYTSFSYKSDHNKSNDPRLRQVTAHMKKNSMEYVYRTDRPGVVLCFF